MAAHGIVTREQRAAFLGQVAAETGNLHALVENDNYTAQQAYHTWRGRFPTVAAATPYAHQPARLTDHVYAGRNGNGNEASGDGYRCRGFIQVTGRANYAAVGHEADPERLADPAVAANSAAAHWQTQGLNARTATELDRSGYDHITRTINAGSLQAAERWSAYRRALGAH